LVGVWIGLAVGLVTVAGTLVALLARTARRPLLALQLDIERVSSAPPDSVDVRAVEPKGSIAA
jgi:hypothetical protein